MSAEQLDHASIGPCGIEITLRGTVIGTWPWLQSDLVELKYVSAGRAAEVQQASIGPCGIEIVLRLKLPF